MSTQDLLDESPDFECAIVETDEAHLVIKHRSSGILYARLLHGRLPEPLRNILVQQSDGSSNRYKWLLGRPARDAFQPMRALLSLPNGRAYPVNVLAALPPFANMRPHLRSGLRPPPGLDVRDLIPIAVEGLGPDPWSWDFRVTSGVLHGTTDIPLTRDDFHDGWVRAESDTDVRRRSLRRLPVQLDPEHIEHIFTALYDEMGDVRRSAAYEIKWRELGHLLPLEPFLIAARDTRQINEAACLAATFVFAAHPAETPVEAVIDLYVDWYGMPVKAAALDALGFFGDRAPIEILAGILHERRAMYGIDERCSAAYALGRLGARAPVDALVAGMNDMQPEVIQASARALAEYPGPVSADVRARAHLLSDIAEARRQVYGEMLDRVRKQTMSRKVLPTDETGGHE